ncbi:DUF5994 family protein [Yinghuangia aomiensis]
MFDGAWWPRSEDATEELPDLVGAINAHRGRIVRVGIHRPHWRRMAHCALIGGNLPVRVSPVSTTARTVGADPQPPRPSPAACRPRHRNRLGNWGRWGLAVGRTNAADLRGHRLADSRHRPPRRRAAPSASGRA